MSFSFDIPKISSNLRRDGFAIIENYLTKAQITPLLDEFEKAFLLSEQADTKRSVLNGDYALLPKNLLQKSSDSFPELLGFLNNPKLHEIVKSYFNLSSCEKINGHVEVEINFSSGKSSASLPHFDKLPALKIFLFLTDITSNSGATYVYPKTYKQTRRFIFDSLSHLNDFNKLENFISEKNLSGIDRVDFECKKGTLLIADTAGLHGGGCMTEKGSTRKVIRATTWYLPKSFDSLSQQAALIADDQFKQEEVNLINTNHFCPYSEICN